MGQPRKAEGRKLSKRCTVYLTNEDAAFLDTFAKEQHWSKAAVVRHMVYMLKEGKRTLVVMQTERKKKTKGGGREKSAAD
jgi:hypothetical protein